MLLAWHVPHKWSEAPWSTGSVHMCREMQRGGRQEEAQRQAQDESAVPLMTRGGPGRCQHFCLTFRKIPSLDGKLLQQKLPKQVLL